MGINGCIKGICVDYNGERFGYDTATLLNPYFEGSKRISDLAVFPLRFHPREQEMRRMIIARGKKLASMHGVNCWEYNGATISSAGHWGSRLYVRFSFRFIFSKHNFGYGYYVFTTFANILSKYRSTAVS